MLESRVLGPASDSDFTTPRQNERLLVRTDTS
jgi:hypothetical protein